MINDTIFLHPYKDAILRQNILYKHMMPESVRFRIESDLCGCIMLYDISKISKDVVASSVDVVADSKRDGHRPWIFVKSDALGMDLGVNLYRFSFIHEHTHDIIEYWCQITLMDSDADRSYVYMQGV